MDELNSTLYHALQGFETQLAMQHNRCTGWPCRQMVRTGVEVAQLMLGDELVEEHKLSYYNLIRRKLYGDQPETVMTVVIMAVLFSLIRDDRQASRCRYALTDDWSDELYDIYRSYRSAVDRQIDSILTARESQTFTISVMKKDQQQTVVYNYGIYNDIHDNPNASIYTSPQEKVPETILPQEGDYSALVRWLELEKLKGNDHYADADYNRTKLCRNLLKIIGWEPDQNSLRKAQNR